jgi:hypothetical protein
VTRGLACCLVLWFASFSTEAATKKVFLLNVSGGQLPPDTGLEDQTKPAIVEDLKGWEGKALKVPFARGDSFGARAGSLTNWKAFRSLHLTAHNPSEAPVELALAVWHSRTVNFQTRVHIPIKLKPGKNEVKIGIDEMLNVDGSAPDLAGVVRWYIADAEEKAPTVYFGDIWLEAPEDTVQPVPMSTGAHADPARLARIRAAKMPKIENPVQFYTPEADAILSALEVYPPDNPWNLVVSDWPLHPNSKNIIASIGPDKPFRTNMDMGFILVPPGQKKVAVKIVDYPDESDHGPFPVPDAVPIEGWPSNYQDREGKNRVLLADVQWDTLKEGGDRHALVVDPINRMLYEFYQMRRTESGWQAAQASVFDLKSNRLRPDGWTSSDAAGLPVFPAVVRYDELRRGIVEHAMRVTVRRTRRAYVYPARHHASRLTDENLPRMGERIRLRQDFDVSGFSPEAQAILRGLQKYGMFVADNGIEWAISVAPDPRIRSLHEEMRKIKGSDFEVVVPPPGYRPPAE